MALTHPASTEYIKTGEMEKPEPAFVLVPPVSPEAAAQLADSDFALTKPLLSASASPVKHLWTGVILAVFAGLPDNHFTDAPWKHPIAAEWRCYELNIFEAVSSGPASPCSDAGALPIGCLECASGGR